MKPLVNEEEIIKYNKRFGIVTKNQLLIYGGSNPKIYIDSINKVKLIKNRVFYTNFTFLSLTIVSTIFLYSYLEIHIAVKSVILLFSLVMLIYTFIHKFYLYKIVIKLNNDELYTMKATQIHRKCIKEFYFAIYERIKKNEKLGTVSIQS